jgi:hypothetical protein
VPRCWAAHNSIVRSGPSCCVQRKSVQSFDPANASVRAVAKLLFDLPPKPLLPNTRSSFHQNLMGTHQLLNAPNSRPSLHSTSPLSTSSELLVEFALYPQNRTRLINNLQTLCARSWQLFAPTIFCFQHLVNSLAKNTGSRGMSYSRRKNERQIPSTRARRQRRQKRASPLSRDTDNYVGELAFSGIVGGGIVMGGGTFC